MFTGIIEETGTIRAVRSGGISASLRIEASRVLEDVKVGDSINTNGVCLTVTAFDRKGFEVDVMAETMRRTNLGTLSAGSRVNLERALRPGDRMGGHIVSGHIDGTGTITASLREENATWVTIAAAPEVIHYIVPRGSVAIDGISLTVTDVSEKDFKVSIIPHTGQETTLLKRKAGETVNIECDITAKYIEKFIRSRHTETGGKIDYNFLSKHGFID